MAAQEPTEPCGEPHHHGDEGGGGRAEVELPEDELENVNEELDNMGGRKNGKMDMESQEERTRRHGRRSGDEGGGEDHEPQRKLQEPDEEDQLGWGNFPPLKGGGRAYHEIRNESRAPHNASRLADPEVSNEEVMEERGSKKGASPPQPEDGLLVRGKLSKIRSTTHQEPIEGEEEKLMDEEEVDMEIEGEKRRISEEAFQEKLRGTCETCGGPEEDLEMVMLGLDVEALFPSMSAASG